MKSRFAKHAAHLVARLAIFAGALCLIAVASAQQTAMASPRETAAAEKHPFTVEDYLGLHRARAVSVSPDGKTILYQVLFDGEKGPVDKHEWRVMDFSGQNSRKLDLPEGFEPSGFTRDGSALYGVQPVGKLAQLAVVPLAENKTTLIIALPSGIRSAAISPDGTKFAVLADPKKADPLAGTHTVVGNDATSLYVTDASGNNGSWWCPALVDITEIAWSPDSSRIAVVTQTPKIGHHDLRSAVHVCDARGGRQIAEVPNATAGIAWSKNAEELVFASTSAPTLTPEHVWTVAASGGAPADRTANLAGSAMTLSGDARGNVYVEVHRGVITETDTFRYGKLEKAYGWPAGIVQGLPVFSPFAGAAEALAFNVADPDHAQNVAVAHAATLEKITHEGDDRLANISLGETKVIHWTAKDGTKLEGIATFPPNFSSAKKYPFLVFPHGGPEANDELSLDAFARFVSGMGYVVIQPEYRGSTGYGSDFLAAIYQHFGDRAYSDVDSATDFAIAQGWADPNRLAIFGWSAGGFMTSWTVTQTHRYKAAIEGAGITDWLSFIPTSDTWQVDYDARMQEKDPSPMLQFSAVMHVDQVTTPLLILHGEADVRVPTFQGREYYVLLAERGKTVRMVTYPGSPHFPRLAEQRADLFKEIADWLGRYNP
ncbi:MAG TPA: S9 family peptidase [Candidatus Acidoferrum sp.]|jgi:dipeptidyl aminopeptidase/acylaminoacyl peptidase